MPLFLLYGAEVFLAAIGARIAVWMLRGWWVSRREKGSPDGPNGPGPGLKLLEGGASRVSPASPAAPFRSAA